MPGALEFASVDVNRTTFEVPAQLKFVRAVGRDTAIFLDTGTFRRIEVRRVLNPLDHVLEARRLLRQLRLRRLEHPNVLQVGVLPPPAPDLRSMYLYTEFMDTDLHRVIHSPQPLTLEHCQYFLYQLLRGLEYLHSFGLVHRDLKPSHLLVNQDCHLRVTGLASAKLQVEQDADVSETFVGVRWYRAPESFLGRIEDDALLPMVDVWASGCILAELVMRRVLFPGRDYIDQIRQILRVVPLPTGVERMYEGRIAAALRNLSTGTPAFPAELAAQAGPDALDFLTAVLAFDAATRVTAREARRHVFFRDCEDWIDEPGGLVPPGPSPEDINAGLSEPRTSFDAHQQLYWECALQTPAIIARDFEYLACHGLEAPGVREWRSVAWLRKSQDPGCQAVLAAVGPTWTSMVYDFLAPR